MAIEIYSNPTEDQLSRLADAMRLGDLLECQRWGYENGLQALQAMVRSSLWSRYAQTPGGDPLAAWGVILEAPLSGVGQAWLLTGTAVERHRKTFVRAAVHVSRQMARNHSEVKVNVDASYGKALRLVRRLGFERSNGRDSEAGHPFLVMSMRGGG